MFLVFQISQTWLGTWIAEGYEFENGTSIPGLVTLIEMFGEWVGSLMVDASPILYALVVDGIIGGVGAVVGFLPLVMVMYFLIALLEDCGYMARVSVVLDLRASPSSPLLSVSDAQFPELWLAVPSVTSANAAQPQ